MLRHALPALLIAISCYAANPVLPAGARAELIEVDDAGNGYVAGAGFLIKYSLESGAILYQANLLNATTLALAVDSTGALYASGYGSTASRLSGQEFKALSGSSGAFVAKLTASGTVAYATILGPSQFAADIAVNSSGEAYVTGDALEGEMPATSGAAVSQGGATRTNFVAKLNAAGDSLLLVERGIGGTRIALDASRNIYVAGTSGGKQDPPTTAGAFQRTHESRGCGGGFVIGFICNYQHVAKLDSSGGVLLWSTFLAGTFGATPTSLRVDDTGNVYVAGTTPSNDFPVTDGVVGTKFLATRSASDPPFALSATTAPAQTGFVAKLNTTGSALVFSTYFGGSHADSIQGMRLLGDQIYLSGTLGSEDLQGAMPMMMQECLPGSFVVVMKNDGRTTGRLYVSKGPGGPLAVGSGGTIHTPDFVTRDLSNAPAPVYCALDSASQKEVTSVAPGQLISLYGPDMAIGRQVGTPNGEGVLPGNLGWRIANFDGTFAKFLYTSIRQANIIVPYEIAGRTSVTMQYRLFVGFFNDLQFSMPFTVVPRSPAAFQLFAPIEYCGFVNSKFTSYPYFYKPTVLARNEDGSLNTCANPARAGSTASIFVNGGGIVGTQPVTGLMNWETTPVNITATMTRDGLLPEPEVVSVTLDPGSPNGVWRVRFRIPPNAQTGPMPASILLDGLPVTTDTFFVWTAP